MGNNSDEKLVGGVGDGKSTKDLAMRHHQFIGTIEQELALGIKIELEHSNDASIAMEIAMDHIYEFPDYYSNHRYGLLASEKGLANESLKLLNLYNELLSEELKKVSI